MTAAPTTNDTPQVPRARSRLSILWSFARPHKGILAFGLLLGLGASAMELANPMVTRWVLDALGTPGGTLLTPVLWLAGLLVVGAVLSWWQWVLLGSLAENIVYTAREGMIRRYLRGKVLPLLRRPAGELVTRVTSDSVLLREAASSSLVELINGIVMLAGTLTLMAVLDVPLAITTVATVLVVAAVFAALMPAISRAQERAQGALGALGGVLERTLRAIKTVKVAGAETRQEDQLLTHAAESRNQGIIAVKREALVWTIASAGIQAAIILILGVGAWRVSLGEMTVPTLVAFLLYAFGLLGPVMDISTSLTTLQAGMAAAGRIRDIDDIDYERTTTAHTGEHTHSSQPGPVVAPARREDAVPVVALEHVTARYTPAGPTVLDDVSLAIPARGHTAVVGPSGAGKTSVFSLLLDFLHPETGRLVLYGTGYEQHTPAQIRSHFAYVEQETPTLPGTLRDNLTFVAPDATDTDIRQVLDTVRLTGLVDALPDGLDTPLTDTNVSGGQRQRIALARALLAKPDVLLLDEATAQLDGLSEAAIHDAIRDYAQHAAVVTIAHRLSTIVDADTITVMDAGRIHARGTHTELLGASPLYQQLVTALTLHPDPAHPDTAHADPVSAGPAGSTTGAHA